MSVIADLVAVALRKQGEMRERHSKASLEVTRCRADIVPDSSVIGLQLAELAKVGKETLAVDTALVRDVRAQLNELQLTKLEDLRETLSTFSSYEVEPACTGFLPAQVLFNWVSFGENSLLLDRYFNWASLEGGCWATPSSATVGAPRQLARSSPPPTATRELITS